MPKKPSPDEVFTALLQPSAQKSCITNKVIYESREHAQTVANGMRNGGRMGKNAKAYKCRECPYWHLTSGKKKGKKRTWAKS